MKLLVTVGVIALFLLAGSAYAGDATYNWSGIYGGASIGYVHGAQDWTLRGGQFWGPNGGKQDFTFDQFDVGAHVGAQYQWRWLVLGAEGSIFKGPYDEQSERSPYYPSSDQWRADIHTIAKATVKVGFAYKRFLGYAKGGYAGAMVDTTVRFPDPGIPFFVDKTSDWHNGWTVGGGIEYALTNHVIIGAEYSYIDLGSRNHLDTPTTATFFNAKVDAAVQQVLFRVSYKFDLF
jgi:outer membrane immunogenic protein